MICLETKDLSIGIGNHVLYAELNLTFRQGESWAVLGANASGKTTLLHTLAGIRKPIAGNIVLNGKAMADYHPRNRARILSLLFQDYEIFFPANVLETVLTGRHPHMPLWQWESNMDVDLAKAALSTVGLAGFEQRSTTQLSGGEHRRVEIATLLAQDTMISLLDEPTNHLDLHHQLQVLNTFSDRCKQGNRIIIVALHDINLALRFCSHALLLFSDGRFAHGPISEVVTTESLSNIYHHAIRKIIDGDRYYFLPY